MSDSYFTKKLEPIKVKPKSVNQLLTEMAKTAYQGRKLGEAVDVWENMVKEKDLTIAMGYAGSMSTAGQWTIVNWLMENRFIDVLVSTGANVSEDIVDAMGLGYWQGSHMVNDEDLLKNDVNRYYDVFGKETDYRKMEELVTDFVMTLKTDYPYSSAEFFHLMGKYMSKKKIPSIPQSPTTTAFQSSAQPWWTALMARRSSWRKTKDTTSSLTASKSSTNS
jgi:deoxyhypusine synthase